MESEASANQELTHCPTCHGLFLGPTVLPCGHAVCRRCVRILLSTEIPGPACPFCQQSMPGSTGQTISELANQLSRDVVMEEAVHDQLMRLGSVPCVACSGKDATRVCLDCGDLYCNKCSSAHRGMSMSREHAQQDILPSITPSTSCSDHETWKDTESQERQSQYHEHKDFLRKEASLFREVMAQLKNASAELEVCLDQLLQLKTRLEKQRMLLTMYLTCLARSDDALVANARAMLPRLKRIRGDCRPPDKSAFRALADCITDLLHPREFSTLIAGIGGDAFDPMRSVPLRAFSIRPDSGDTDQYDCWIRAVAATRDGSKLVMTDWNNRNVKVAELNDPEATAHYVSLDVRPHRLAVLWDGHVAVTSDRKCINFLSVDGRPRVVSHVQTVRQYRGVCSVDEDEMIIVSCRNDKDGPASLDVITRAGTLLKTVTDSNTFTGLSWPTDLCRRKGEVLVSDFEAHAVFRIDLSTGRVVSRLAHPELREPHQVAADKNGNCYVTSDGGQCVLVATPDGQWRRLLHGPEHGDATRVYPMAVCVTCWGIVVTWDDPSGPSIVSGYDLT